MPVQHLEREGFVRLGQRRVAHHVGEHDGREAAGGFRHIDQSVFERLMAPRNGLKRIATLRVTWARSAWVGPTISPETEHLRGPILPSGPFDNPQMYRLHG